MTMVDSSGDVTTRTTWRWTAASTVFALVAVLVAVVAAFVDRATVTAQGAMGRAMFGYPLNWLAQNQTSADPPFPATLSPGSPWENPTSVALGPLVLDVLIVYVVLLVGWFVGRFAHRGIRTSSL